MSALHAATHQILRAATFLFIFVGLAAHAGPLHEAAKSGDLDRVKQVLVEGTDVNAYDGKCEKLPDTPEALFVMGGREAVELEYDTCFTPLHWAARKGFVQIAELLIAKGANVEVEGGFAVRPLHFAAASGHLDVVEMLLAKGSHINTQALEGRTALHYTAPIEGQPRVRGHKAIAELLIKHGADVRVADKYGHTPLHQWAIGDKAIVELLIAKGADVNARDSLGRTALDHAASADNKPVVEVLSAGDTRAWLLGALFWLVFVPSLLWAIYASYRWKNSAEELQVRMPDLSRVSFR